MEGERPMKRKAKSLPALKKSLQEVFNKFIRMRDFNKPCISCGGSGILQAGHFYSVRMYDGLRFNEDNVHGECCKCNGFDDMHLVNYSRNLLERIGPERFNDLSVRAVNYKMEGYKWTRDELNGLIQRYKELTKNN
jgi:hypothetical protein